MNEFRPASPGMSLVYAHFGDTTNHVLASAVPVVGWLQGADGEWRPAVMPVDMEAERASAIPVATFLERQRAEHVQVAALLCPADDLRDGAMQHAHDILVGDEA